MHSVSPSQVYCHVLKRLIHAPPSGAEKCQDGQTASVKNTDDLHFPSQLVIPSHSLSSFLAWLTPKRFWLHLTWINVPGEKLCLTLPRYIQKCPFAPSCKHHLYCPPPSPKTPNFSAVPFLQGLPFPTVLHESCSEMYQAHSVLKRVRCTSHIEKCPSLSVFKLSRKPFLNWWAFGTLRDLKFVILLSGEI